MPSLDSGCETQTAPHALYLFTLEINNNIIPAHNVFMMWHEKLNNHRHIDTSLLVRS